MSIYKQGALSEPFHADAKLEGLHDVRRRLDRLLSLKARAENCPPSERGRLLGNPGLFPDELLDGLRKRVQAGEDFDKVVEEALRDALSAKASLAKRSRTRRSRPRRLTGGRADAGDT